MFGSKPVAKISLAISILLLSGSGFGCASAQRAPLRAIIEPDDFAARLNDQSSRPFVILDMRDQDAYLGGHVEGAVRVDPEAWKNDTLTTETGLKHDALWRERIGSLGVSGDVPVVIYDDGRMTEAARLWFIFQHFGVAEAAVLNGGYRALKPLAAKGNVAISQQAASAQKMEFQPSGAGSELIGLIERERVLRAVEQREAQLFDARTKDEFTGKDMRRNPRGGHIPTAINLPHTELLDENGLLKGPDALARLFGQAGFERDRPIITHCDSGGRASLAALAAQRAGYGPVLNYYLSFGDWAADVSCPVETGE